MIGQVVHQVEHHLFADRSKGTGTGVALQGALGDLFQGTLGELQLAAFQAEKLLILLDQRVLRLGEDADERLDIQRFKRGTQRQSADKFGDHAEFHQIFRLHLRQHTGAVAGGFTG